MKKANNKKGKELSDKNLGKNQFKNETLKDIFDKIGFRTQFDSFLFFDH